MVGHMHVLHLSGTWISSYRQSLLVSIVSSARKSSAGKLAELVRTTGAIWLRSSQLFRHAPQQAPFAPAPSRFAWILDAHLSDLSA